MVCNVQTIKSLLKKADRDGKDFQLCLLEYRNTPLDLEIGSPAQLLFSRRLNGLLPITTSLLEPKSKLCKQTKMLLSEKQSIQKKYYDRQARDLVPLKSGARVGVQRNDDRWHKGTIIKECIRPRSYQVQLDGGAILERNRRFMISGAAESINNKTCEPDVNNKHIVNNSVNEKATDVQRPTSTSNTTRSGRTVRLPSRFADYQM